MLHAVVSSNMNLVGPPTHMSDKDVPSLTDSVSNPLKSTLDDLAPYYIRIQKQEKSAPWFHVFNYK